MIQPSPAFPSDPHPAEKPEIDRRSFLGTLGLGFAAGLSGLPALAGAAEAAPAPEAADALTEPGGVDPQTPQRRREAARKMRNDMAQKAFNRPLPPHPDNGEEGDYPYVAAFSKGLPHTHLGDVRPKAYRQLLAALRSGRLADFEALPMGSARPLKLKNPLAALGFDLEGADSHSLKIRPAPRIDSAENSAEAAELYWMALARDVHFLDYETDPTIAAACDELSAMSDFRAPKAGGRVTPHTIFRDSPAGNLQGPYISQFLYRNVQFGTLFLSQRGYAAAAGVDWATDYASWLALQRGQEPDIVLGKAGGAGPALLDPVFRYLRNGRDLATYVHFDALYQAYVNACFILSYERFGISPLSPNAPFGPGNPYSRLRNVCGFGTFGLPHVQALVAEVATRALKAAWYQKWYVHRRLRPETFGGRVHNHLGGSASYPIDPEILDSRAVQEVYSRYGTYLLPQAYQEGAPLHPAYPSGHATVAGACTTVLKAFFDESAPVYDPVIADAEGVQLLPYSGADADRLTVGGELNKLASNIASGRNFAALHWRTDMTEGLKLGEQVAICLLQEQMPCFAENGFFEFTRFNGRKIRISG